MSPVQRTGELSVRARGWPVRIRENKPALVTCTKGEIVYPALLHAIRNRPSLDVTARGASLRLYPTKYLNVLPEFDDALVRRVGKYPGTRSDHV